MGTLDRAKHYLAQVGANKVPVEIVREDADGVHAEVKSLKSGKTFKTEIARLTPLGNARKGEGAKQPKASPTAPKEKSKAPAKEKKPKRLSLLEAAKQILASAKTPMTCPDLVNRVTAAGLWSTEKGLTPAATLNAAIHREMKLPGEKSAIVPGEKHGTYSLRK